jgi:hypothetical protein
MCGRGREAVHDRPLLRRLALKLAGVAMHRPPLILMAAYVRLRDGHQGRGALRARAAIAQEPRSSTELLIVLNNRNGRLARLRLPAEAPKGGAEDAVLLRAQARRQSDIAFRSNPQHDQAPSEWDDAAAEPGLSIEG